MDHSGWLGPSSKRLIVTRTLCVCVREVDGEERGVPADAVSHLLDKSLICVIQRGITGFWEEKNGTLNAPIKPDTQFDFFNKGGFVLNTSHPN